MTGDDARVRQAMQPLEEAMRRHARYRGKMQMAPKVPVAGLDDFAVWYTPGVAAPCLAIRDRPEAAYDLTNKGNTIAIVSDGTRVLGLGDIGPLAGLPVMEGKALLFKVLGGVDAVPLCLDCRDPDALVRTVRALAPSFGAINLEDIAQPKCFRVLDALRGSLDIPVWHDDQQGTATVLLAGLTTALAAVGKELAAARIAMVGMGAANVAAYRLLTACGADPGRIVACDSVGTLHPGRSDIAARRDAYAAKWRVCTESNRDGVKGGIDAALAGADVCIAFAKSGPGVIDPAWVRAMAPDAIVFACANPNPEIWPWEAAAAGARIVGTGRSDFPNQINNALAFPGIFRGVLDVRARTITDGMAIAAARAIAARAAERGEILPPLDDAEVAIRVAVATGIQAQREGVARVSLSDAEVAARATAAIAEARRLCALAAPG
ncbi:MAG: NADP-dependent malic enzyme [Rhodospirillaceae bacterium]